MKPVQIIVSILLGGTAGFVPVETSTRQPTSLAFFGSGSKKSITKNKSYPQTAEAVAIYTDKYMSQGGPQQKPFFQSWGMPAGYSSAPAESTGSIFDRQSADLSSTFNTMAELYGPEEALAMVKIQPGVLAFNKDNFGPCLDIFGEKFGLEESKGMILRNPGLLSTKPSYAEKADDLTMQLSYVVGLTRPIGNFGPFILIALVSVPAIESALGIGRGELLSYLFNQ